MNRYIKLIGLLTAIVIIVSGYFFLSHTPSPSLKTEVEAQGATVDWPQLQHDAQHTGRTSVSVANNYKLTWAWIDKAHTVRNFISQAGKSVTDGFESGFKFTVLVGGQVQPIIAEGKVFFGGSNGIFYAVDALTGSNLWDKSTGGAIFGTAAYAQGVVVVGSYDRKVYAFNTSDGSTRWSYQTGAGVTAAPVVYGTTAYVGSRDGSMYAFDMTATTPNGAFKWRYDTRDPNNKFNKAPIMSPAAVSEDGSTVLFGAENMYFYALTSGGLEKWTPKKLIGQSFLYTWPMVKGNIVIARTMSSLPGAEYLMESVLDGLSGTNPAWSNEKLAVSTWLSQNPHQKTMYVITIADGQEPYQVAMGRVTGNNYPAHISVVDNQNRILTYWRSKWSTIFNNAVGHFGTNYCPDISAMDAATGDRVIIPSSASNKPGCPELDNGFQMTVGGNWMYLHNHFRGAMAMNLSNGDEWGISGPIANRDGGMWRGGNCVGCWGYQIIYYGNDTDSTITKPPDLYNGPTGFAGIAIAQVNGRTLLFINEGDAGTISAIEHQ